MLKIIGRLRAIILPLLLLFAGEAAAQMLRPARTVYDLKLDQRRASPGIDAAKGRLIVELHEDCDGYIFNQGLITDFISSEGPNLIGDMQASVWESRDGRQLRFNLLNRLNGKVVEREQGRADLNSQFAGNAVWHLPKARQLALPKGTIFPIAHNRAVLEHALEGDHGFESFLFDGSYEAGLYRAATFIGRKSRNGQANPGGLLSKKLASWPIRLAYFRHDNRDGLPEFEVGFTLYSDGVVDNLQLDYPEFGLTGQLVELEYFDRPVCD